MEAILKDINTVLGVHGSFVCLTDGQVAAQAMPAEFDAAQLETAARVAAQTFRALEASGQRVIEADLLFASKRLLLKNLRGGVLAILCARNINLPLLNLTANVAVKKLNAELKPKPTPPPPAPATPSPAPAPTVAPTTKEAALTPLLAELEQEMLRLLARAAEVRVTLRNINPLAMWYCCPQSRALLVPSDKRQLDFAALAAQASALTRLFEQAGYQAHQRFNAFYGDRRLVFLDTQRDVMLDLYLDAFEMYHRFDLKPFLTQEGITLTETPLLLTRLQHVEIGDDGLSDICALLLEHDLSVGAEKDKIDVTQITRLCADDWGWYKTATTNLARVASFAAAKLSAAEQSIVAERIQRITRSIDDTPKSLRWQTRARLGETSHWYETPIVPSARIRPDMAIG